MPAALPMAATSRIDPARFLAPFGEFWRDPTAGDDLAYPWPSVGRQLEIRREIRDHRFVSVASANAMGKSADIIPKTAIDYLLGHYPARVVITGASWQSLVKTVVPNLRRCVNALRLKCPGIFKAMGAYEWTPLGRDYDLSLEIVSTLAPERIQGRHCVNTLVIVDEASGLAPEIAIAIDSFTQSATSRQIYSGNPLCDSGPFFDSHNRNKDAPWRAITLSAMDSPNILAGKQIVGGMATPEWVEAKRAEWGEDSAEYRARVLGLFPEEGSLTVISRAMIERGAALADPPRSGPMVMGLDIARSPKGDWTVWIARDDAGIRHWEHGRGLTRDEVEGRTKALIRDWGCDKAYCDDGGLVDLSTSLRNAGLTMVKGIMAGSAAHNADRFLNCRAEMYQELADAFRAGKVAIPKDLAKLLADEAGIQRKFNRAGKMQLESKDELKERIGRSPDHLDALALTFVEPPGELVILPESRPSCLLATKPVVWIAGDGKPTLMVEGLNEQWHREGDLLRACWYSPRGPSGAMWLHRDGQDGAIVEFKAIQIEGRFLPTQFARAVVMESRDAAGRWHDYAADLKGTPAELGHEEMQHSVYEELDAAFDKAYRDLKAEVRLPWNVEREALDEFAGWAEVMEWMAGAERKQKKGDVRMLLFSTEAAYRQVLEARYEPESKTAGEGQDQKLEAVGGGGPLVRCLRMLAVEWARE